MTYREYYLKNRDRIRARQAVYRDLNREAIRARHKKMSPRYNESRRKKHGHIPIEQYREIIRPDPDQKRARRKIYDATFRILNVSNTDRTVKTVGCRPSEFRRNLERQFSAGMTWDNYGTIWEVDHIKPLGTFDLTNPEQFLVAAHFSNTRPILVPLNYKNPTLKYRRLPPGNSCPIGA